MVKHTTAAMHDTSAYTPLPVKVHSSVPWVPYGLIAMGSVLPSLVLLASKCACMRVVGVAVVLLLRCVTR